jgi:hypothetical protein
MNVSETLQAPTSQFAAARPLGFAAGGEHVPLSATDLLLTEGRLLSATH